MQISLPAEPRWSRLKPMTDTPITVRNADYTHDGIFLMDAHYTYVLDALEETGGFPRGGLLLTGTSPHLICRGARRVGAASMSVYIPPNDLPEVQVDTIWLMKKYRGRGYAEQAVKALLHQTALPVALRAPVHPALQKVARRLGVRICEESPEESERQRAELASGLARMRQECVHGTGCKPCFSRLLHRVTEVAWQLELAQSRQRVPPPLSP
jgi:hypothetical protein